MLEQLGVEMRGYEVRSALSSTWTPTANTALAQWPSALELVPAMREAVRDNRYSERHIVGLKRLRKTPRESRCEEKILRGSNRLWSPRISYLVTRSNRGPSDG